MILSSHDSAGSLAKPIFQASSVPSKYWKLLRSFCYDVVGLRRGDHSAERLRLQRQFLALRLPNLPSPDPYEPHEPHES